MWAAESPPPEPPAASVRWHTAALLLVVAALFAGTYLSVRSRGAARTSDTARMTLEGLAAARQAYWMSHTGQGGARLAAALKADAVRKLAALARAAPSPSAVRRLALMQYWEGDSRWAATLLGLRDLAPPGRRLDVERELDLWRRVLTPGALRPRDVEDAAARVAGLNLGWFKRIALEALYRNAGENEAARRESEAAQRTTAAFAYLNMVGLLALGLGAVLLLMAARRVMAALREPGGLRWLLPALPPPLPRVQADRLYLVFLAYLGTMAAARFGLFGVARALVHRGGPPSPAAGAAISLAVGLVAVGIPTLMLLWFGRRGGPGFVAIGIRRVAWLRESAWGLLGYITATPLLALAVAVSAWAFRNVSTPMNPAAAQFAASGNHWWQGVLLLHAVLVAPVSEEVMFRGVFYRALQPRLGVGGAALVSAAVFAVLHPQLPIGFAGIFVLGLAFTALYLLRGSLLSAIVAHALNNGVIFISLALLMGT